ncbi:MAG: hypothetical protein CMJ75_16295 [Planctomycetaceae bacterium]|nr:hypothetical protein [Planctomycetaceae bacterium]
MISLHETSTCIGMQQFAGLGLSRVYYCVADVIQGTDQHTPRGAGCSLFRRQQIVRFGTESAT